MTAKNGDLPAMPNNIDTQTLDCMSLIPTVAAFYKHSAGLTKREQFAAMAMQGLMTRDGINSERLARIAATAADALLAELERTK